ncbi:response regulator [Cohnella fermenti]|uniref:Circadian input-output histidine kinase CikA n=1 Tax=Cohnella fermenti TaxID=2565925 RepID=A0A4S4C3I6_9BACL|nr:response regulator [Cohnella fermenti]THF82210.1 response regulator [Cohnella fermenti]
MERDYSVNILVVDDRPENLLAIEAVLEGEPYRLVKAHSGPEALRCLLREEIAVILLDVQMPGMDGFETAGHIQAYEGSKHIPIIFITATSKEAQHFSAGYSAGAIDYMVKPFVPHILKAKIKAFVRLYDMQKKLQQQAEQLEKANAHLVRATSELTKAEAQARAVMETSLDAVLVFNPQGRILKANPATESMFGYAPDELPGRSLRLLVPGLPAGELRELEGKVWEVEPRRRDGGTFPAEIQLGQSPHDDSLLACSIRDITERKQAEKELLEAKELAERASTAKSEFLSFLSHEIRNPLNGVIGMMDLLLDTGLKPEQRELAEMVMQSGNAMVSIMNDVLDYSKLEAGRMEMEDEPFLLKGCLEQVRDIFTAQLWVKKLEFVVVVDPELPGIVRGDVSRLQQVLLNLVGNSVKFTNEGGIYVFVNLLGTCGDSLRVEFTVKDTGIGIPADKVDRLFRPFSQAAGASTNRKYGGSGLGLAISKTLVELMGGSIRIEAPEEPGATFVFSTVLRRCHEPPEELLRMERALDWAESGAEAAAATAGVAGVAGAAGAAGVAGGAGVAEGAEVAGAAGVADSGGSGQARRILMVEDQRVNQKLLLHMLNRLGHTVEVAENGAEALRALGAGDRFDMVLADIHMPVLGGLEMGHRWQALRGSREAGAGQSPTLIALTADQREDLEQVCREAGFAEVLRKPIRMESLRQLISRYSLAEG